MNKQLVKMNFEGKSSLEGTSTLRYIFLLEGNIFVLDETSSLRPKPLPFGRNLYPSGKTSALRPKPLPFGRNLYYPLAETSTLQPKPLPFVQNPSLQPKPLSSKLSLFFPRGGGSKKFLKKTCGFLYLQTYLLS